MARQGSSSTNPAAPGDLAKNGGVRHPFASLSVPSYRAFWISLLASYGAMQMNIVARGYLAFTLTHSATALGFVSLARGISMLVLSPFAGVIADRVDKRRLLVTTQTCLMLIALTTAALIHFGLIQFWHLVVLGFLEGAVFTFNAPTRQAIIPQLVPGNNLGNAIALNASGRNLTRIVGPSLAGILIGLPMFGNSGAFDAVAIAYLIAAVLLFRLELHGETEKQATAQTSRRRAVGFAEMSSGFRYILSDQRLLLLVMLGFVPVMLGNPYATLLPVFQARVLHVGPQQLGMLYGAAGVGGVLGTLLVASIAEHPRKAVVQLGFGMMFASGLILFALVHVFVIDLLFLVIVGLAGDGYSTLNSTMLMLNTDRAWYGRVMSIYMMNWSLMPLATMPLGALADFIGAPATEAAAGSLILLIVASVAVFYPNWRKLGETAPVAST